MMTCCRIIKCFLLIAVLVYLQGCIDAAVTGAQVAYNHDRITKGMNDQYITTQAYNKLFRDSHEFDDANISVATFHREILLTGQIPTPQQRKQAEAIIKTIPDVKQVYNFTEITAPASGITRISDTWITTKIKSKLIAMNDIDPNQVKVVTENGTVFLMGMVQPQEADIAIDVARTTDGVQSVVKLFTYLRISKT
jgi:osmotically-inducible protein OsmY